MGNEKPPRTVMSNGDIHFKTDDGVNDYLIEKHIIDSGGIEWHEDLGDAGVQIHSRRCECSQCHKRKEDIANARVVQ